MVMFSNYPLLWVLIIKTDISISNLHSEYLVLSHYVIDLITLNSIIKERIEKLVMDSENLKFVSSSTLYEDNTCAIFVAKSPRMLPVSNHINIRYNWSRQHIGK